MFDYIVEGINLDDIDSKYNLPRGTTSEKLSKYKITGKDVNWQGSYKKGLYNGKYNNDTPYVVKSQIYDNEEDVEVFIDKKVLKDFIKKRYEDETLEEYLERKYALNDSFLNGLGIGTAIKRGAQKGKAEFYKSSHDLNIEEDEKEDYKNGYLESKEDYLNSLDGSGSISSYNNLSNNKPYFKSGVTHNGSRETISGHGRQKKLNPFVLIGSVLICGVLAFNFCTPFKNFVMVKYIDFYSAKLDRDKEKALLKMEEEKVSTDDKPGIIEYNGLTYSCRSIDGVPYKEALGISENEMIAGMYANGKLNGSAFHKVDNTIEIGHFEDDVLSFGVYFNNDNNKLNFIQVRNKEKYNYKVVLEKSEDTINLSAFNLDEELLANYIDGTWYDLDGNEVTSENTNLKDISFFYIKDGVLRFSFDSFSYTKSGWLRYWNDNAHMIIDTTSNYMIYDTTFETDIIKTETAKYENFNGGFSCFYNIDGMRYERQLNYNEHN